MQNLGVAHQDLSKLSPSLLSSLTQQTNLGALTDPSGGGGMMSPSGQVLVAPPQLQYPPVIRVSADATASSVANTTAAEWAGRNHGLLSGASGLLVGQQLGMGLGLDPASAANMAALAMSLVAASNLASGTGGMPGGAGDGSQMAQEGGAPTAEGMAMAMAAHAAATAAAGGGMQQQQQQHQQMEGLMSGHGGMLPVGALMTGGAGVSDLSGAPGGADDGPAPGPSLGRARLAASRPAGCWHGGWCGAGRLWWCGRQ
ncbi:MAG: hypothetical protein WDW36_004807 [Sanguina aurantia]